MKKLLSMIPKPPTKVIPIMIMTPIACGFMFALGIVFLGEPAASGFMFALGVIAFLAGCFATTVMWVSKVMEDD